jgi:NAD(P)-dependent dehydrogenase (short-subunit alcohol dehydrogenase family)
MDMRAIPVSEPQVVIVTGGSWGIGAATARLAAQRGFSVCVNYAQQHHRAEEVADTIRREGGNSLAVRADVSSEPEVLRLFKTVDQELGRLTALVNNAATLECQTRLESIDSARLQRMFATNVIVDFGRQ